MRVKGGSHWVRLALNFPYARSIRELARLSGVSVNSALNFVSAVSREGRLRFEVDEEYFGLVRLAAFSLGGATPSRLPPGTRAVREFDGAGFRVIAVLGLVPYVFRERYLRELGREMSVDFVVEGVEFRSWFPREDAMTFFSFSRFSHVAARLWEIFEEEREPPRYEPRAWVPDDLDMRLLAGKLAWGPFVRPREILTKLSRYTGELKLPSRQAVSYHYRRHVLPGWAYNTYHMFYDSSEVPFWGVVLRGREAPALARVLVYLPYSGVAYIGVDSAFYMGQVACSALKDFFSFLSSADVEPVLGPMVMKLQLKCWTPRLWKFVEERGRRWVWRWPEEVVLWLRE